MDCYLPTPAVEVNYLTSAAAQARYLVLPNWFKTNLWFARGLVLDNVLYSYYAFERMLAPDVRDWQIFLDEYIVFVDVAWLHAVYNDFSLYRLSPALGRAVEDLPDNVADVFGRMRNLEDLRSPMRIHNGIEWTRVHRCMSLHSSGLPPSTDVDISSCGGYLSFDAWGRFFMSTERMRQSSRFEFGRLMLAGYPLGLLTPGTFLEADSARKGFHVGALFLQ